MNGKREDSLVFSSGFNSLRMCRYGAMLNDIYVGKSLDCYGEFSEKEIELFSQLIRTEKAILKNFTPLPHACQKANISCYNFF